MAAPGTISSMPHDVAHAWKSTGAEPGRVLFLYKPGHAGKLFEEPVNRPIGLIPEPELAEIMRRHGWEIVGPTPC